MNVLIFQERTLIFTVRSEVTCPIRWQSWLELVIPKGRDLTQFFFTLKKAFSKTIMYIQIYPEVTLRCRF